MKITKAYREWVQTQVVNELYRFTELYKMNKLSNTDLMNRMAGLCEEYAVDIDPVTWEVRFYEWKWNFRVFRTNA